jgi:hypothetical protein
LPLICLIFAWSAAVAPAWYSSIRPLYRELSGLLSAALAKAHVAPLDLYLQSDNSCVTC